MRGATVGIAVLLAAGAGGATHDSTFGDPTPGSAAPRQPPGTPGAMGGMRGMRGMRGARQSVALGDSVFHGTAAGGTCYTCHGADAKGTPLAPDLTDTVWLNGDGGYPFVVRTVMHGVPRPKRFPAPMPAMGGARLTPAQVHAVAAYVHGLSRFAR